MATQSLPLKRSSLRLQVPIAALVLWTCLWCNLNTGFWNIAVPNSLAGTLNLIRAILPFIVLPTAGFILLRHGAFKIPQMAASRLLLFYGLFATLAAVFSPQPIWSLYWSIVFLATILVAWTFVLGRNPAESARQMLQITWVATFIVAAIIGYQARGVIFSDSGSGYGVIEELNGLTRSSGVARWAAVPGLVCLVRAYHSRRFTRVAFFLGAAAVSFFIVYRMQSRGAVFGSVAAVLFALLVSSRMRRYALPFVIVAIVSIIYMDPGGSVSSHVGTYLKRGQSTEEFDTMTGRTRAYDEGLEALGNSPFLGYGQWADRLVIGGHVHNSFLQALLNGGILGGIPYFASWVGGWWIFYKVQKRSTRLEPVDRIHLLECGAVMMFFTVRAIPETTTASYAVDLLVMVAVYVYLETLSMSTVSKPLRNWVLVRTAYPQATSLQAFGRSTGSSLRPVRVQDRPPIS